MRDPDFDHERFMREQGARRCDRIAIIVGLCGVGFIAMLSAIILSYL